MEPYVLIVLFILGIPVILAIWLITRIIAAKESIQELTRRLGVLESEVFRLKKEKPVSRQEESAPGIAKTKPIEQPEIFQTPSRIVEEQLPAPAPMYAREVGPVSQKKLPVQPPPLVAPPPMGPTLPPVAEPQGKLVPTINWEKFMGVKLFAWISGLAFFFGVAFFVKYSFDNNLVPPELRVAIGFLAGLGLLVGGIFLSRRDYQPLSQTLCGTGVVVLYSVTFACRSIYHFPFFGALPTFLLMVLITTAAFLLAVRLHALVVAILGLLGGFLTPILLSTGEDNPLGLFGYIAILDIGLILIALRRQWFFLVALAAAGTILLQIGWLEKFFVAGKYFEGNKILIPLAVLLGFNAIYLVSAWWARRRAQENGWLLGATLGLASAAVVFTGWFLTFAPLAQRPWLMFGFVVLLDLTVIVLTFLDERISLAQLIAGLSVFGLLAIWTGNSLNGDLLDAALAFYFIFAVLHSMLPAAMQRCRKMTFPPWGAQLFPPLALILLLIPILRFAEISFVVWPFLLLVDLLAIALAVISASLIPVLAVLILTLAATGALIFKIPATLTGLPTSFFMLGAFAIFFVMAGVWLSRKLKPDPASGSEDKLALPENLAVQLPALSAVLPFLLLMMATLRLPLTNPSPVFGLALLLVLLLLGLTKMFSLDWMPAVGLVCVTGLECAWHFNRFSPSAPIPALVWYLIFYAVFALFPFLFMQHFRDRVIPWGAAAMAGLPQFFLIHRLIRAAYPNDVMGLLAAAFAIPPLLSLVLLLKRTPDAQARMTQLAWFGAVALFFITLIFPIQFERQWITLGWAMEGAALLWLFHRVPHPGLRLAGAGLLAAAFVRLAFNPAVLDYHARSATPLFNWYLYAYGIVTACLFTGAWLLAPPRHQVLGINIPPILAGLGTVLAFLLLNIEIADYFSSPGSTLTFQFNGNFARDMTYSIAWALFALGLVVIGIVRKTPVIRYAGLGLLSVTLLKLFLHDLARLGQLYRIGAFIGVAIIAMLASFAYQRFFREREGKPG